MGERKKILIVEDDDLLRSLYAEMFKKEGFDVYEAEDGLKGERLIMEGGYDVILLDILLPEKDGLEILRSLKSQIPKEKNGPIVLISNLGQEEIVKKGIRLGAKGYLIKSQFRPEEVITEIKTFI